MRDQAEATSQDVKRAVARVRDATDGADYADAARRLGASVAKRYFDLLKVSLRGSDESNMRPTPIQKKWLSRGLTQAGGKLPLFDENGQQISTRTVRACVKAGWAEPWRHNPVKPDWLVCRLTAAGRQAVTEDESSRQREAALASRT